MSRQLRSLLAALLVLPSFLAYGAEKLVIDFMVSSGPQRTEWNRLITAFKAAHPEIEVTRDEKEQKAYKQDFSEHLKKDPVDIAFWFAGAQLSQAKDQKLVRPLNDEAASSLIAKQFAPATVKAVTLDGKVYGVPLSYYQWGFFYKQSTFKRLGLTPPTNWAEFRAVSDKLKAADIKPTVTGAKNGWPAMAWFDYLNMRINGLDFHRKLLRGEASFKDAKVAKVFETWKEMLTRGDFDAASTTLDWDEVLPLLYRDKVGMSLMGAFAATKFAPAMAKDIAFFPFPQIATPPTRYEEAPLDILVFPSKGQNPGSVVKFVKFLAENSALNQFNEATQLISPRLNAPASSSATLAAGKKLLDGAAGISFFFDRDASPKLAEAGGKAFTEFLAPPHDTAKAIQALDAASR
jgi:multiple sugar transport system substrate-binding protein